jgi:hypothetical protein
MRLAFLAAALAAALVATVAGPAAAQYGGSRCIVRDPTGTPLNLRERPQGRVIGSPRNGTYVRLVNTSHDGLGRPRGYIVGWDTGRPLGWVFREFISCY